MREGRAKWKVGIDDKRGEIERKGRKGEKNNNVRGRMKMRE